MPPDDPPESLSTRDVRTLLGLLSEDEVGRAIGVQGSTVRVWRQRGYGPVFFRFKRNLFYRTADVTQWLLENTIDPGTDEYVIPRPQLPTTSEEIYEEYPGGPIFNQLSKHTKPANPEKIIAELDRMVDKLNATRPPDDQLELEINPQPPHPDEPQTLPEEVGQP